MEGGACAHLWPEDMSDRRNWSSHSGAISSVGFIALVAEFGWTTTFSTVTRTGRGGHFR